ncbi:MAG: permease [Sphingomonas sp. SCN 67-18]|uniref:DMT family transporter n=1 Tax=uncultured Sphingomonas sp. TaxID=158754 RepID=UPI00086BFF79|nr:DMT family transporter [Sphingomonas sp. SCN 67-18]ODU20703.1 MAG: permease [Sphingomonas sp. SCN 67-18]
MTTARRDYRAYAMLALVMLFWAGNAIVGRAVRGDIPPFTLALVRWTGAFLIVLPMAVRPLGIDRAALLKAWRPVLALGLVGVASFNALLYTGLHHTTATNGLLIQAAIPAMVLVADRAIFGIRAGWASIIGVALSTLGVAIIVFRGTVATVLALDFGVGDVMILIASVAWALYTSLLKLRPAVHPMSLLAVTFAIGALAMLPLAATEWRAVLAMPIRPGTLLAFAYVALLPSVVAYFLYNGAVGMIGAGKAGQTISLMPLFGALLAAGLLGEALHDYHLAGMVLILIGIAVPMALVRGDGGRATAAGEHGPG